MAKRRAAALSSLSCAGIGYNLVDAEWFSIVVAVCVLQGQGPT
jgi:hypothetical protein